MGRPAEGTNMARVLHRKKAEFRLYEELNDFLPPERRKRSFEYRFSGTPTVKDAIEAIGAPHTEVDCILVNGISVGFDYRLQGDERVAVYPVFELLDIKPVCRLRPKPLREPRFVLDVHLGALARSLRMLGFDSAYRNDYADEEIIVTSVHDHRIILTRDLGILKYASVTHGYWLRSNKPGDQLAEVLDHFDLYGRIEPFRRCIVCNNTIEPVAKNSVEDSLPPFIAKTHETFFQCGGCGKVYWQGSHYSRMAARVERIRRGRNER